MYKALYRKWRPLTFEDVVSQPHITTTLKNQIMSGKTAHAYLFTGSRGTGKTTCARIFAKAINCAHCTDGNPCLECEICKEADESGLVDIIEIDAASNNGVDDIRELREGAVFTPQRCRFKVYIIDEVHMLSAQAFNALLKIIEEPPEYVKFILATTEIHKVPVTILSRCQRFDFHRILPADIVSRLTYIAEQENISVTADAAALIAAIADGGMRDALSLLDRCIAYSDNITAEIVSSSVGIADRSFLFDILENIADGDAARVMEISDKLYNDSKDMQKLCEELIYQFRNLMLMKTIRDCSLLVNALPGEINRLKTVAEKLSLPEIMDKLSILQDCNERLVRSLSKRVELEMCLIRLCGHGTPAVGLDNSEIYDKIKKLESRLSSAQPQPSQTSARQPVYDSPPPPPAQNAPLPQEAPVRTTQSKPEETPRETEYRPVARWDEIMQRFAADCPAVSGVLSGSSAYENGVSLVISTPNSFFISLLKRKENAQMLGAVIKEVTGVTYRLRAKCTTPEEDEPKVNSVMNRAAENGIPTEMQ